MAKGPGGGQESSEYDYYGKKWRRIGGGRVGSGEEKKWGPREDTVLSRTIRGRSGR